MLTKLVFPNNVISLYFFFFSFIIDLSFLILAIITQILNHIVELTIPLETLIKFPKVEMEIDTVPAKTILRKCSMKLI